MPWRGPRHPGEFPTLGWTALAWMTSMLSAPDRPEFEPFEPTRDQASFLLRFYEVHPVTGKRLVRRGVYSRPKGCGKSPFLAAIAAFEGLGDAVPDGYDAHGEPVGRPWASVRIPLVQIAAVSEDQTMNAYQPLLDMLANGPVMDCYPGLEPMQTFIALPFGKIQAVTSAPTSREGNKGVFALMDQTESWYTSNGGVALAAALRRNAGKVGGSTIEAPNAYVPGMGSVSERTAEEWQKIREGRKRLGAGGVLVDHREAPPETDMANPESLRKGLEYAYGDSAESAGGWVDIGRLMEEIWDGDTDPESARQYYLNQIVAASDSWLTQPQWAGCVDVTRHLADRDIVTLGFDGSRKRTHSVTDATGLVACRVSDGHMEQLAVWEQPEGTAGEDWEVPTLEVCAAVHGAFKRFRVCGMYCDPAKWESYISDWEARYHDRLAVKVSAAHPMHWWMTGGRARLTVRALEQFHNAVVDRELSHDGSYALTRHILNARRRISASGIQIAKEFPTSPRKIDLAIAAVLAWQARLDAVAQGLGMVTARSAPARIR